LSHARWLGRLLVSFGAASAGALLAAGPASAATVVPLHDAHRNTTAAGFSTHSCAQIPGGKAPGGADGWVFVLPKNDAEFVSLTLQYRTTGGTTATVTIPNAGDPYPDGFATNGASKAWVVLPAGWTLLDGSAVVSGETKAAFFNLTHTCPGKPSQSGTPSKSPSKSHTKSPSESASPSDSGSPSESVSPSGSESPSATPSSSPSTPGSVGGSGGLPQTGAPVLVMFLVGASTVIGGTALLLLSLRRRKAQTAA
jgi:LPXTG-motif cell wall-anchored protein